MTPDEKKVLAEMLGLHIYKGKLIRLVPSPNLDRGAASGCTGCVLFDQHLPVCGAPTYSGAGGCGLDKIYVEWKP